MPGRRKADAAKAVLAGALSPAEPPARWDPAKQPAPRRPAAAGNAVKDPPVPIDVLTQELVEEEEAKKLLLAIPSGEKEHCRGYPGWGQLSWNQRLYVARNPGDPEIKAKIERLMQLKLFRHHKLNNVMIPSPRGLNEFLDSMESDQDYRET